MFKDVLVERRVVVREKISMQTEQCTRSDARERSGGSTAASIIWRESFVVSRRRS